jgi:hypothetical protein
MTSTSDIDIVALLNGAMNEDQYIRKHAESTLSQLEKSNPELLLTYLLSALDTCDETTIQMMCWFMIIRIIKSSIRSLSNEMLEKLVTASTQQPKVEFKTAVNEKRKLCLHICQGVLHKQKIVQESEK